MLEPTPHGVGTFTYYRVACLQEAGRNLMAIIGKTHLISHFRHKRKRAPKKRWANGYDMANYHERDSLLRSFGFASYSDYLASDMWRQIRSDMLQRYPRCVLCWSPPEVVHHIRYNAGALLGLERSSLVCLCNQCHETIEIDPDGNKRGLEDANSELFRLANDLGRTSFVEGIKNQRRDELKKQKAPSKHKKTIKIRRRRRKDV